MLWHEPPHTRARTHKHTRAHISLQSLLSLLFSALPHLFVMFHLPGLFECINQSSCGAIAITHLVRIRERENERESTRETEKMTDGLQRGREERGRTVETGKENRKAERGSCSIFIYLLISILTSRLFISLASTHSSVHPTIHSFSQQPVTHPFTPIYRRCCLPTLPPNHASIFLSISPFPLHPAPHHLSIFLSFHLYLTLSLRAFLIHLYRIFATFRKQAQQK